MADTAQAVVEENVNQTQPQNDAAAQQTQAQSVDFPEVVQADDTAAAGSIDILLDMNVPVTVTVGQTEIQVRRLLQLGPGSVIKLDRPVDAPVDLYLKDTKFATGSVVVVDNHFAVRIKQVLGLGDAGGKEVGK
ncbi:MAG: FliM/FliN family flagellar motor switch protein [Planctomycetota bacterium]|nr:FliM/FliN family flagellar motor switch protein [Planctomycetota bacterium]